MPVSRQRFFWSLQTFVVQSPEDNHSQVKAKAATLGKPNCTGPAPSAFQLFKFLCTLVTTQVGGRYHQLRQKTTDTLTKTSKEYEMYNGLNNTGLDVIPLHVCSKNARPAARASTVALAVDVCVPDSHPQKPWWQVHNSHCCGHCQTLVILRGGSNEGIDCCWHVQRFV
jgi:hypothetical protein